MRVRVAIFANLLFAFTLVAACAGVFRYDVSEF
jgi:hypothetical protein